MNFTVEARLRIAGVEVLLRADDAQLVDEYLARAAGYTSGGGPHDVVMEYTTDETFEFTASRLPYPALDVTEVAHGVYRFARNEVGGTIHLPAAPREPLVGRFTGRAGRSGLETPLRVLLSLALPRAGGLLLHSSGIAEGDRALVFSGQSGAGKTTIVRLISGAETSTHAPLTGPLRILGDDLVALRPDGDRVLACATPFNGEFGPCADGAAPLESLSFLRQAAAHALTPLARADATRRLLRNTLGYALNRAAAAALLTSAAAIAARVPCRELAFARDSSVRDFLGLRAPE
ncbi:MAG: hypothetical protein EXR73_14960 [Myxococcales bacterium]|nr:hypothetical protein [Myxococcales bacterium]